eukprot:NP_001337530.1 uncharacterized protein LOC105377372 [Homo sapiens]
MARSRKAKEETQAVLTKVNTGTFIIRSCYFLKCQPSGECLFFCSLCQTLEGNFSSEMSEVGLSGQQKPDDSRVVQLVSPGGVLPRIFGLPPESQCLGPPQG